LIAFESGHYKKAPGIWKEDSVWAHFIKPDGGMIHVNKEKVEYMETFGVENVETSPPTTKIRFLEEQKMEAEIERIKADTDRIREEAKEKLRRKNE
jgi:phosphopantothenoylcysteine synthetase/decarboxylase